MVLLLATKICYGQPSREDSHKLPNHLFELNMAESMFEIFYEWWPGHIEKWQTFPNKEEGASYYQNWDCVQVKWNKKDNDTDTVFVMVKDYELNCEKFDNLVFFLDLNHDTKMHVWVKTDKERISKSFSPKDPLKEYTMGLKGASEIQQIRIAFTTNKKGIGIINFRWIGLQNEELYQHYLSRFNDIDSSWNRYLKPDTFNLSFEPKYGIILTNDDIEYVRNKFKGKLDELKVVKAAKLAMQYPPEEMIGDFINLGFDNRYSRDHDRNKFLVGNADPEARQGCQGNAIDGFGIQLAIAGIILEDEEMLRMAARYAMSITFCTNWNMAALGQTTGVLWDHRSYLQSMCAFHCAIILDLAGELFTRYGKEIVLRRIVEDAMGQISFTSMKFDYIFKNNSLMLFQTGRMAGAMVAKENYRSIGHTVEEIFDYMDQQTSNIIFEDGGFAEGPGYFTEVVRGFLAINYMYAQMYDKDFKALIEPTLKNTENYVAATLSTVPEQVFVPICDGSREDQIYNDYIPFMASLFPDSYWVFLNKMLKNKEDRSPSELFTLIKTKENTDPSDVKIPYFLQMENNGMASSLRRHNNKYVKVFIMGNSQNAGHNHEDVGSFILEWAGETYAMDPGMTYYSDPATFYYKYCQYHNMLLPYGVKNNERIHPIKRYREGAVAPAGKGDSVSFNAAIDATPTWDKYYKKWVRSFDSPSPDRLTITDEYELSDGEGVEFIWNTKLPVSISGKEIKITGNNGHVVIDIPGNASAVLEKVDIGSLQHNRIIISKKGKKGKMALNIRLY